MDVFVGALSFGRPHLAASRARTFLLTLAVFLQVVVGLARTGVLAAEPPRLKKEMQAIRAVVEENFRASNLEDVDAVMATMTPYTPNRDRFIEELKQFFDATDVYARLVDVSFVSAEVTNYGPIATVKVVQQTLPQGDAEIPYSEFRTRSAMLPPWEVCEYEVVLHKIRGKWLAHLMGGDVREAQLPAADEGEATRTRKVR